MSILEHTHIEKVFKRDSEQIHNGLSFPNCALTKGLIFLCNNKQFIH